MSEPPHFFRFAVRLSHADYLALNEARRRLGPFGRFARAGRYAVWYLIFLVVLIGPLLPELSTHGIHWPVFLEWDVAGWVLLVLAFPFLLDLVFDHVVLRWYFHRSAASKQDVTADIDGEGVRWTMGHAEGRMSWPGIPQYVIVGDRVFLFIDKVQGITLPKRGLVSGDWDDFLAFIRGRMA